MHNASPLLLSLVLAALAALAPFAIDTYLPAFHTLADTYGVDNLAIQHSLTAYLLPYALMTLWHGAISDAIGRLRTIYWGLGIFALASIGCALAPNVETLWLFRALQGMSAGAGNVVARAMVRDLFSGVMAQKVMAQLQMLFGIAPAVAPIIGGWLLGWHWQMIFFFLFAYAALVLVAVYRWLPETWPSEKRSALSAKQVLGAYRQVFSDVEYNRLAIAVGANFAGFFIYVLSAPVFLIEHLHLSEQQFAMMFIPTVVCTVFGSYLAKRYAGRIGARTTLQWGYGWMCFSVLLNILICVGVSAGLWNIVPIAFYNIGMAFVMPILSVAALDRFQQLRGTAASGQAFIQMCLATVSAGLVIPLLWSHPAGLACGMAGYMLLGWWSVSGTQVWSARVVQK
jgi:DHA1 family bicyclomycin/chloramphenicol resistance-like MFS transporter